MESLVAMDTGSSICNLNYTIFRLCQCYSAPFSTFQVYPNISSISKHYVADHKKKTAVKNQMCDTENVQS